MSAIRDVYVSRGVDVWTVTMEDRSLYQIVVDHGKVEDADHIHKGEFLPCDDAEAERILSDARAHLAAKRGGGE